ncbi:hypothetical protein AA0119_g9952 [Alternaria tenuissima]|uniref:F-box domain-containing protein n=1 Tax=Alternaria tenuissima TaxID=119927 RepID=A0A4Q4P7I7_9PLEO|nr:hypothetical protein AA0115_g9012 [Alternaria tenuissima]RYN78799.1 hypothetical protein AA0120_g10844 [Alternaria tenuissima]RYN92990.1 hypothetical protein AA0119_g9952 [Alternaria tenuissima]RYO09201.1 hypothetical protein AA0121_g11019 [Alternaria tenuissima]RYO45808.1 hypothetical protein AA0116_g13001 [Alternaria tenuissima]
MSEITHRNRLASPFLRLPAEIRNTIYTYVGTCTQARVDVSTQQDTTDPLHQWRLVLQFRFPDLLVSCKQIRNEAKTLICKLMTVDTDLASAFGWLHSHCDHEFCKLVSCLRVPRDFAASIALDAGARALRFENRRYHTLSLPSLEKIVVKGKMSMHNRVKVALRRWARNKSLEVVFEEEEAEMSELDRLL